MANHFSIYQGKLTIEALQQDVLIEGKFNEGSLQSEYFVQTSTGEQHELQLNLNTDYWEEKTGGVTPLSAACGKVIEDYFG